MTLIDDDELQGTYWVERRLHALRALAELGLHHVAALSAWQSHLYDQLQARWETMRQCGATDHRLGKSGSYNWRLRRLS
jgi:hypothetical protein